MGQTDDQSEEKYDMNIIAKRIDIIQDSFRLAIEPVKVSLSALHNVEEEYMDYGIAIRADVMTNILIHWIETGKNKPQMSWLICWPV